MRTRLRDWQVYLIAFIILLVGTLAVLSGATALVNFVNGQ